jgi:hypothetical protein
MKKRNICKETKNSGVYVRCIRGFKQYREIDRRNETYDSFQGSGVDNSTVKKAYYYGICQLDPNDPVKSCPCQSMVAPGSQIRGLCRGGGIIVSEGTEVVECFPTRTLNRLVLVNAFEKATQNPGLTELPKEALFDPRTGIQLYEIGEDEDGKMVIYVKDECLLRRMLSNTRPYGDDIYSYITDSNGNVWQTERRNLKPRPKEVRKRLLVEDSCHSQEVYPSGEPFKLRLPSEYQKRRALYLNKTKFECGVKPYVQRFYG